MDVTFVPYCENRLKLGNYYYNYYTRQLHPVWLQQISCTSFSCIVWQVLLENM